MRNLFVIAAATTCFSKGSAYSVTSWHIHADRIAKSLLGINESNPGQQRRFVDFPSFTYDPPDARNHKERRDKEPRVGFVRFDGTNVPVEDIETAARRTRLLNERSYAQSEPFEQENISVPPTLSDLSPPSSPSIIDRFFFSTPASLLSFAAAYYSFPFITHFLQSILTTSESHIDEILDTFAPGIAILYGTLVSLTLSILYTRQRTIQDNVAVETSLLTIMMRNLLSLFRNDEVRIVEGAQCLADQIRTLVRSSRGEELMLLMYNDPYARMLELVDDYENELYETNETLARRFGSLISFSRTTASELTKFRAKRLSDETLALPPTHFFILNILSCLILLGYALSVVPTVDGVTGNPPPESSLLFGSLASIYLLFYNFAHDLNNPFQGIYQVRRSCAASHLLEAKWVIANHPLLRGQVDFEEIEEDEGGEVLIQSPGLGEFWFHRDMIYLYQDESGITSLPK